MALRGIRALGIALGLGVAGADNMYETLTNQACREMTGDAQCSGAPCLTKFDVLTSITNVADCKMICDALEKTCTGYEYGSNRCEIWKAMIMGSSSANGFNCYNRTDDGSTETDEDLYVWFTGTIAGMNNTAVMGMSQMVMATAATLIKRALAGVYGEMGVMILPDNVKVNFTDDGIDVGLINNQADKRLPLRMYRLIGTNSPGDGLSSILPTLTALLTNNYTSALQLAGALLPDAGTLTVAVTTRRFSKEMPTDMFPPVNMNMNPTTTTAPSQDQVNAAPARGPKAVSACFVFLFAGLGLAWLMP